MNWRYLPALTLAAIIFVQSGGPVDLNVPNVFDMGDKVLHMGAFGVLAILLVYAFRWPAEGRRLWMAVLLSSLYGLSDEVHQSFVPERNADVWDLVADVLGAVLAVGLFARFRETWLRWLPRILH